MILYHGSNTNIQYIDLNLCRPYKDFGKGFYLTDIKEQAQQMAIRVAKIYGGNPVLNAFFIQDNFQNIVELNIKNFGKTSSKEWAEFILNNRNNRFTNHKNPLSNR